MSRRCAFWVFFLLTYSQTGLGSPLEFGDTPKLLVPSSFTTITHPTMVLRQEETTTLTYQPTSTSSELFQTTTGTSSTGDGPTRTVPALHPATTPIPLAATMGLIMPNPWRSTLYAGVNYTFGFVDPNPRPAPTVGGWLRHVQPLLVFPDYTVNVFPGSGQEDPGDEGAVPFGSQGLCGATVEDYAIGYPFMFVNPGWYMYVVNQTWVQPTIDANETCQLPLISQKSFFASQVISIAPRPTLSPYPPDPTSAYTIFATISTVIPTEIPHELSASTGGQKLAVGLGVTGAFIALGCIAAIVWWVKKKHKMEREVLAFSRLSEADRTAFLAENPDHFLNPNRPTARNAPRPPAPQGTLAYAQWYGQQMWDRQHSNWGYGGTSQNLGGQANGWQGWNGETPGGRGYGYQGVPGYGQMQQTRGQPAMAYKTH